LLAAIRTRVKAYVHSIGLLAPGLSNWMQSMPVLAGEAVYRAGPLDAPHPELLPPAERRRTGLPVKLALAVGQQALESAGVEPTRIRTIFASSGSDGEVLHELCETLAGPQREISPTRFHNSVHNAPAGYWGIATRAIAPSISLACYDATFAAGLIEAAVQLATEADQVLLICCDVPYPEPLAAVRPISAAFACALLLSRSGGDDRVGEVHLSIATGSRDTALHDPALESLRRGNPAARSLALLAALASGQPRDIALEYVGGQHVRLGVRPC
jgi:hypothetical protein